MAGQPIGAASDLAAAGRLWLSGRPLEAGRALTALIPPEARPRWAGRIVAWAATRSKIGPLPAVQALVAATARAATPDEASAVRDALLAALRHEERSGRFNSLREAVLALALNAARLLVAATAPDPPDPREGWWFVASLKCVGDELDADFAADAWSLLSRFAGCDPDE